MANQTSSQRSSTHLPEKCRSRIAVMAFCLCILGGCGQGEEQPKNLPKTGGGTDATEKGGGGDFIPVSVEFSSREALFAAAPKVELVEHEFKDEWSVLGKGKKTIVVLAPKDATIETNDAHSGINVTLSPNAMLQFRNIRYKMEERKSPDLWFTTPKRFRYFDKNLMIAEFDEDKTYRYKGFVNVAAGDLEFSAHTENPSGKHKTNASWDDTLLLLKCALSIRVKEPSAE